MKDEKDIIIEQRLKEVPPAMREALRSEDLKKNLIEITKTHKLLLKQADVLETEVVLILLGLESAFDLAENLERIDMPEENVSAVLRDVKVKILDPIQKELVAFTTEEYRGSSGKTEERNEVSSSEKTSNKILSPKTTDQTDMVSQPTQHRKQPANAPTVLPVPRPPHNPFEEKFKQNVQSERSETRFRESSMKKEDDKVSIAEKKRPYSIDPYREPIE